MGIGVMEVYRNKPSLILMEVLKLSSRLSTHERLFKIHEKVSQVLSTYKVQEFAIEAPFFGKNVQSMLKLGRAQGVAIAAAIQHGVPVTEYSPRKIKQSVTGNGNADKIQVLRMLQRMLNFTEEPKNLDATDALAVAMCHHFQSTGVMASSSKMNGWEDFMKKNPGRVSGI